MDTTNPLQIVEGPCCTPAAVETSLHDDLTVLLSQHDVNAAAASVKVYAIKPRAEESAACCGPELLRLKTRIEPNEA